MKALLFICLVAIIIVGLYYLVESFEFVGLLTVIGIGLYFWISKKLKNRRVFSYRYIYIF